MANNNKIEFDSSSLVQEVAKNSVRIDRVEKDVAHLRERAHHHSDELHKQRHSIEFIVTDISDIKQNQKEQNKSLKQLNEKVDGNDQKLLKVIYIGIGLGVASTLSDKVPWLKLISFIGH